MVWKSRSKDSPAPRSTPRLRTAACQRCISSGPRRWSAREEYSRRVARLGIAFRPAKRAGPSSRVSAITWDGRPIPRSLRASRVRKAQPAGIMLLPGLPACSRMPSGSQLARSAAKRNTPPEPVRKRRGARSRALRSAVGARSGRPPHAVRGFGVRAWAAPPPGACGSPRWR